MKTHIPTDHSHQVTTKDYLRKLLPIELSGVPNMRVMDFGCGAGQMHELVQKINPSASWTGIDITDLPFHRQLRHPNYSFCLYDGLHIPFADNYFQLIYSNQVLEHVRHPETVLHELERVLAPGGYFIGSTSYLEPYHAFSYWNYTPYGFAQLLENAGFKIIEIRPSIDSLTLILRNMTRGLLSSGINFYEHSWDHESYLNRVIELFGRLLRKRVQSVNGIKLQYCGQFCWWAQKRA